MYSHPIVGMIAKENYVKASEYLLTVSTIPGDHFSEYFRILGMRVLVREEMLKIASTPLFEKERAEEIGLTCEGLMRLIELNHYEAYFKEELRVIHYNLALSLAVQQDPISAIEELRAAQAILEPTDRIVQARVKCGLAFLTTLHGDRCPSPSHLCE